MRSTLSHLAIAGLLAASPAIAAQAPAPVHLSLSDVLGESIELGATREPAIVFFMSKRSSSASSDFARAVDERLLAARIQAIAVVDVRKYAGWLRGIATSRLKSAERDARETRRKRRADHGVDASPEAVARWHLIGDFDGSVFDRFGVEREPARPIAFVIDRGGAVRGPFFDVAALVDAAASAVGGGS